MKTLKIFLFILLNTNISFSQNIYWEKLGAPHGYRVQQFSFNSENDIFITTSSHNLDRSTDNGNHWTTVLKTSWAPLSTIAIDSVDNIYVGTFMELYKSSDNGETWKVLVDTLPISFIHTVAISPKGHIFIGANGYNYRSRDKGMHWDRLALDQALKFLFLKNGNILAGVNTGHFPTPPQYVYCSTDDGDSWIKVLNAEKTSGWFMTLNHDGTAFVATSEYDSTLGGVYQSKDNGLTWMRVNNGLPSRKVNSIDVNSKGHVFVGVVNNGVYRSLNKGDIWNDENNGMTDLGIQCFGIDHSDRIFIGTNNGIYYASTTTNVSQENQRTVSQFELFQNYPNPFNPRTTIKYSNPQYCIVTIKIYNMAGKEMGTILDGTIQAGTHEVILDASSLPNGIYLYRINTGKYHKTRKFILVR